jgi:1-deoxy-D-xylulose-5-phosphate reductoisomerase
MGPADMRLAISYALSHPDRWPLADLAETRPDFSAFKDQGSPGVLTFEPPDRKVFRALALAEEAGRSGGIYPAVLNAANETAVEAFLTGRLSFTGIAELVERALNEIPPLKPQNLDDVLAADAQARKTAAGFLASGKI